MLKFPMDAREQERNSFFMEAAYNGMTDFLSQTQELDEQYLAEHRLKVEPQGHDNSVNITTPHGSRVEITNNEKKKVIRTIIDQYVCEELIYGEEDGHVLLSAFKDHNKQHDPNADLHYRNGEFSTNYTTTRQARELISSYIAELNKIMKTICGDEFPQIDVDEERVKQQAISVFARKTERV